MYSKQVRKPSFEVNSMKKFAITFLLLLLMLGGFAYWIVVNTYPVSKTEDFTSFTVIPGSNATQIGTNLFKAGLIKNPTVFKLYMQFSGSSFNIQAGSYKLSPSLNLFQTVGILSNAPVSIKVTIPEGFDNSEIAARFTKSLNKNEAFKSEFLNLSKSDQGYLFPDTYSFEESASPAAIIAKMKANFETRTKGLNITRERVTLASVIEKETKGLEERPIVAGILLNRLNANMPLQVDVAPETYQRPGLPDNPIANPGLASIKAAVNPAKTNYWYYIHDSSGTIHYAKTLDEQNENINKYLR